MGEVTIRVNMWLCCPVCGPVNADNWPLEVDGEILDGGCQECWEAECSRKWWAMLAELTEVPVAEDVVESAGAAARVQGSWRCRMRFYWRLAGLRLASFFSRRATARVRHVGGVETAQGDGLRSRVIAGRSLSGGPDRRAAAEGGGNPFKHMVAQEAGRSRRVIS